MTTIALVFTKIKSDSKTKYDIFIHTQKQKHLLMKVTLVIYLNQPILQLH